jgi:hypothetical protein
VPTIWTSETGREWRRLGASYQVLALYLITNPHANAYGLYYLPMVLMVEETGVQRTTCMKALETFAAQDFAFYDERTEWTFVKNMAARQMQLTSHPSPRAPVVAGLRRWYENCPANPFLGAFFDHYGELFGLERRDGAPWSIPKALPAAAPVVNGTRSKAVELFEQWWPHYPKPVGKKAALGEWLKISPAPDEAFTQRCIETVERQKRSKDWIKEGGRWIPEPERWLKKGRWDDSAPELPMLSEDDADRLATYGDWIKGGNGDD